MVPMELPTAATIWRPPALTYVGTVGTSNY